MGERARAVQTCQTVKTCQKTVHLANLKLDKNQSVSAKLRGFQPKKEKFMKNFLPIMPILGYFFKNLKITTSKTRLGVVFTDVVLPQILPQLPHVCGKDFSSFTTKSNIH